MDEFEKTLNRVLSDPEELAKITRLAGQLMGGGEEAAREQPSAPGIPELLKKLSGGDSGGDKAALVKALSPYLREDRRRRLQKAMGLARAARAAGIALNEFGGEAGV